MPYEQRDHAWFVGYAPQNAPEVVVVTMTEHGGFGGSTSGPVTAEVLRTWFTKTRNGERFSDLPPIVPVARTFAAKKEETTTEETQPVSHDPTQDAAPAEVTP